MNEEILFEEKIRKDHTTNQLTLKPRICIIGSKLETAVVRTVSQKYTFNDPVQALECCFKIFLSLNTKYPRDSDHVWEFIQKKLFMVNTSFDKNYTSVETFISTIDSQI